MLAHWYTLLLLTPDAPAPTGPREVWRGDSPICMAVTADSYITQAVAADSPITRAVVLQSAIDIESTT